MKTKKKSFKFHFMLSETISKISDKVMDRICSVEPIETMKRAYDIELPELDDEYLFRGRHFGSMFY